MVSYYNGDIEIVVNIVYLIESHNTKKTRIEGPLKESAGIHSPFFKGFNKCIFNEIKI